VPIRLLPWSLWPLLALLNQPDFGASLLPLATGAPFRLISRKDGAGDYAADASIEDVDLPYSHGATSTAATMTAEPRVAYCHECKRPLVEADFYGERLKGCPTCNIWWTLSASKKRLSEEDIRALHLMMQQPDRGN